MEEKATISGQNATYQQPEYPPPYEENPSRPQNQPYPHPQNAQVHGQTQPILVQPQPGQSVIVVNPVGSMPSNTTCRSCNMQITTSVVFRPSARTHLAALLLCLVGCWPFACVPYCIESCNSVDHYCPNCRSYIGTYHN
ncbi:LITAF-like zinc ribbon domain-containing protein [Phthorimaea operculella]|nr:LITAF-like zinc ribbon domain-containing protein [Phthorimaea operculella]